MPKLRRFAAVIALIGGLMASTGAAHADNVIASWIQLGPGSSGGSTYGDQPASTTPTILARAVISGGACPALMVDGTTGPTMTPRFDASTLGSLTPSPATNQAPFGTVTYTNGAAGYPTSFVSNTSPSNFPDGTAMATTAWTECEAVIPAGHIRATIGGQTLKLPIANPQRILVLADTGCRMSGSAQQNCHSAAGFPFAALAAYEAQFQPDLIVHVGDYFYRDTNCIVPAAGSVAAHEYVTGCSDPTNAAYEPWADTFDSWNADVFYPGKPLLAAAPWVMTRGNHESCGRGARGWFAFLDPHPYNYNQVNCLGGAGYTTAAPGGAYSGDFTPTYVVPAGQVNLLVHDSSFGNDSKIDTNMSKNYDYELTALLTALGAGGPSRVFVTHKPTFGLVSGAPNNGGDFTEQYAFTGAPTGIGSAFTGGVPASIALFLSGHIHQFEYVNFNDYTHYAPQMIVGVGGDNLDPTANPNGTNPIYAYQSQNFTVHDTASVSTTTNAAVGHAYSQAEFGFAVLQATTNGYIANVYNIGASRAGRCTITLVPRNIACWD
jgi:hypothetical protein